MKYNEFNEVISVNGLTTGHHLGAPMQDAVAEKPEDNQVYATERNTITRNSNVNEDEQPKPIGGSGGSGGGGGTPSGNIKKKFMPFVHVKKSSGTSNYDFVATLGSVLIGSQQGVAYYEEVLPTKTSDGIKESTLGEFYFYFIEDENNVFLYGDFMDTGAAEWVSLSMLMEVEFGGVITDTNQLTPNVIYVFFYYVEADGE